MTIMESTLVSARISRHKKEQAVAVLDSLGVTVSDPINSAFDYAIEQRGFPQGKPDAVNRKAVSADKIAPLIDNNVVID